MSRSIDPGACCARRRKGVIDGSRSAFSTETELTERRLLPFLSSAPPRALILPILWRTRIRGRPLRLAGDWKVPAAANCHEPEREAENRAGNRHCGRREPQRGADHDHGRAGQGGNGVKIGAQHDGDLRQEHNPVVALQGENLGDRGNAALDAGDAA